MVVTCGTSEVFTEYIWLYQVFLRYMRITNHKRWWWQPGDIDRYNSNSNTIDTRYSTRDRKKISLMNLHFGKQFVYFISMCLICPFICEGWFIHMWKILAWPLNVTVKGRFVTMRRRFVTMRGRFITMRGRFEPVKLV